MEFLLLVTLELLQCDNFKTVTLYLLFLKIRSRLKGNQQQSMKTKFVCVTPKSSKAKNRFVNIMEGFHSCKVEQETNDKFFLVSLNRQYCFWIQKSGNEHWGIE
jgi:protein involved in ribonucleotide reduction